MVRLSVKRGGGVYLVSGRFPAELGPETRSNASLATAPVAASRASRTRPAGG